MGALLLLLLLLLLGEEQGHRRGIQQQLGGQQGGGQGQVVVVAHSASLAGWCPLAVQARQWSQQRARGLTEGVVALLGVLQQRQGRREAGQPLGRTTGGRDR